MAGLPEDFDPTNPTDIRRVISDLFELLHQKEEEGSLVSESLRGTPKDSAVQKLAAWKLSDLRNEMQHTYAEIGKLLGVSTERVRQLYTKLCEESEKD